MVHTDADHASCPTSGRSYTGITFAIDGAGAPYDWVCERQTSVAKDNNRAETHALARAATDTDGYHRHFMSELGAPSHTALLLSDSEPSTNKLYQYNSSTKTRAENVLLHHAREIARAGTTQIGWIAGGRNHSDALTKRLPAATLAKHTQELPGALTP